MATQTSKQNIDSDSDVEIEAGDGKDCEDCCENCGLTFLVCQHGSGSCSCEGNDEEHVFLRGRCIFCIFEGNGFEDSWDSLWEVLDGIALKTYNLGLAQGKERKPLFPLSKKAKKSKKRWNEVIPLYELYKAGHQAGMNL